MSPDISTSNPSEPMPRNSLLLQLVPGWEVQTSQFAFSYSAEVKKWWTYTFTDPTQIVVFQHCDTYF
jgi:hypothetical protein